MFLTYSFFRKKLPIVVQLMSVEIISFRCNLIFNMPIDLKVGLNVGYVVMHYVISCYNHIIVLFSCAAVISSHPMSSIICIIIVFITELYYYYIFIELLMYFCYNTSYVF